MAHVCYTWPGWPIIWNDVTWPIHLAFGCVHELTICLSQSNRCFRSFQPEAQITTNKKNILSQFRPHASERLRTTRTNFPTRYLYLSFPLLTRRSFAMPYVAWQKNLMTCCHILTEITIVTDKRTCTCIKLRQQSVHRPQELSSKLRKRKGCHHQRIGLLQLHSRLRGVCSIRSGCSSRFHGLLSM